MHVFTKVTGFGRGVFVFVSWGFSFAEGMGFVVYY